MEPLWKSLVMFLVFRVVIGTDQENTFALDLFKQVYAQESNKNFVLSPPIIRATLSFLYLTANWNAALEIQHALQIPEDKSEATVDLKNFLMKTANNQGHLHSSSKIYRDPTELSWTLLSLINEHMKPEVTNSDDPDTVISILPKSIHMPNYDLLVTTASNLSASWKNPFNTLEGRTGMFKFDNGYFLTDFMKKTARFGILKLEQFTALEIPYDSDLSMVFAQPNDEDVPLSALVNDFDLLKYQTIDSHLRQRFVEVSIPRFVVESSVSLGMSLARMGLVYSFLANAFDFYLYRGSGLGPIDHTGSMRVLEGGTEEAEDSPKQNVPPALLPSFRADRPFLYLVRNTTSKDILMIGHYSYFDV
ncbi:leukocyte elastase inhibitor [Aedes albopictus]|uniref:Serpin domain-containing protein n=1 Tax=Aedes albopictus TaxID=7160 RepID=A0ABM1ZSA0_AEDAL|nr:leukocyte elastase inhibitor-like [Aedes albopictus]